MKLIIRFIFVIMAIFFIDITVYAYTAYKVGDEVTYNGINYYVIKDSDSKDDSVTMLKAEPLSVAEVNEYGAGHVNRYIDSSQGTAYDNNGYGAMQYYSSATCGYNGSEWVESGCTTDYAQSEVKYVVDAWKTAKAPLATEVRLITFDEIVDNFNYERYAQDPSNDGYRPSENTPSWVYNSNYWYWTMTPKDDSASRVWSVNIDGGLNYDDYRSSGTVVRPVITLSKTAFGDTDESVVDNTDNDDKGDNIQSENKSSDDKKETTTKIKVENTYMRQTLIIMIIGFISICSGVVIYYLIRNKRVNNK